MSTRAMIEAAKSGGEMPIDYMLRIMRDENAPDSRRDRMAKAAAIYLHAKLSTIEDDREENAEHSSDAQSAGRARGEF